MVSIVAGYRFVDLADPADVCARLHDRARAASLRGTLLVAAEGLNATLAGEPAALQGWLDALAQDERFADMPWHRHEAAAMPFGRLVAKVKREIIRMDHPALRPADARAPTVDAATLARWLAAGRCDEGREVVLLDTRNAFEVDAGAFRGALDWRLQRFGEFPQALERHRAELEGKTVVSYCTGGIRCEKAALWMRDAGVDHVRQLDGGILGYFERCPGAPHWQGGCFVFDGREQVRPGGAAA